MISITSETNTVQKNSTEEKKINHGTNGNGISNVEQMSTENQMEELHIVNESTSENDEEDWNENENNEQNGSNQLFPNKYIYEEFAGYSGERYLRSILSKAAPLALRRTWQVAVSFQAVGKECYVSVKKMLEEVGTGERKLYQDYDAMERRGWLSLRRVRMDFTTKEGKKVTRAVTIKDFRGLYAMAHDYHLWRNSGEYLAPIRANVPLILEDKALVKRLIRFENYRRLLVNEKPGRKKQGCRDYYEEQEEEVWARGTDVQELNISTNGTTNATSLYRKNLEEERETGERGPNLRPPGREEDIGATAIRNEETKEKGETKRDEKKRAEEETSPKRKSPPYPERESAAAAKRAELAERVNGYTEEELKRDAQKRGAAAAGIPAEHYQKLRGEPDRREEPEVQPSQSEPASPPRRQMPAELVEAVTQFATFYDSPHLVSSDVTRATKMYFTAAQTIPDFRQTLFEAFLEEAVDAAKEVRGCEHTNSKGRVNRIPYFFTCLENALSFSLEELVYLRTDEPLYGQTTVLDLVNHLRTTYNQQVQDRQTELDYRSWLEWILDEQEHRKQPKQRNNVTAKHYKRRT